MAEVNDSAGNAFGSVNEQAINPLLSGEVPLLANPGAPVAPVEPSTNMYKFNMEAPAPMAVTPEMIASEQSGQPNYAMDPVGGQKDVIGLLKGAGKEIVASGVKQFGQNAPSSEFATAEAPQQAQAAPASTPGVQDNAATNAIKAIAKAASDKADADVAVYKAQNTELAKLQSEQATRRANFEINFNDKMKSLDELSKQQGPEHFWANTTSNGKVAAGIAILLGGLGGGLARTGKNVGLEMIDKAIDRDMEAQHKQVGAQQNLLTQMRAKFQDDQSADTATRLLLNQSAQNQISIAASRFAGESAKQNAVIAVEQLKAQQAELQRKLKLEQAMAAETAGGKRYTTMQWAAAGAPKEFLELHKDASEKLMPPDSGWDGKASTKEGLQKFQEFIKDNEPALTGLNRIRELKKNYNKFTDVVTRAKIDTEIESAVGALRLAITGPGILTEAERSMIKNIIGSPNFITTPSSWQDARFEQIGKKLKSDIEKTGRTYGFRPSSQSADVSNKFKPN